MHHATTHVHRTIIVDVKRGAFIFERRGGFHIEQVGARVGFQAVAVGTDVSVVAYARRDEQSAHRVRGLFHLADDGLQVGQSFLFAIRREL